MAPRSNGTWMDPSNHAFPLPWVALTAEAQEILTAELQEELAPQHVLYGRLGRVVAKCRRCDDTIVLVGTEWAVVHLSWVRPDQPPWPWTTLGPTLEEVIAEYDNDH